MTDSFDFLLSSLPSPLSFLARDHPSLQEIRLCVNAPVVIVDMNGRHEDHLICTRELLDKTLLLLTEYSFYSHEETIKEGYLSLPHGIRVGLCGRAVCQKGQITAVKDITFLCIRIPRFIKGIAHPLYKTLRTAGFQKGVLLYSLPGVGKTTVLKDLIAMLAASGKFVAVIDQRGEFSCCAQGLSCMIYKHYPKVDAITMAIKTTTPDLLILDEIGSEECTALLSCALCGVPVIASAHGEDAKEICARPGFDTLFRHRMFELLAGLTRKGNNVIYSFTTPDEVSSRSYKDQ